MDINQNYLFLDAVAETVDSDIHYIWLAGYEKPDVMNITHQKLLYFAAGVDIIHVCA